LTPDRNIKIEDYKRWKGSATIDKVITNEWQPVKAILEKVNKEKANLLYDYLDQSKMFQSPVAKADRSIMNVTFVTGKEDLDALFVKEATAAGLVNLKGHRSVGGMRASIYNAMPLDGVAALVDFMKKFEAANA